MSDLLIQNGILLWDENRIKEFRYTLLKWYDKNKRDLPWRQTSDPYAIWVSEIMLQQTQVATVIPYFLKFMSLFPTISSLAEANESLLLKAWEGLGYYSRVLNMQKAAQQIMKKFNGKMPSQIEDIKSLTGIGPYTAGAIASIAFKQPYPAVDGNVMRIMARLFEINLDIGESKNRKVFEELVSHLIDPKRPGDFNQALMDLGSDICSAKSPRPEESPIKDFNQSYQNGTMAIYPIKKAKKAPTPKFYRAFVMQNDKGELFFEKRPANSGVLKNMWLFPLVEKNADSTRMFEKRASAQTHFLGTITHVFSHLKWHVDVIQIPTHFSETFNGLFIHPEDFHNYPMPTPQQKMLQLFFSST